MMKYYKYHALGNDYIVLDPEDVERELTPQEIRLICHRNFGVGSDGILLGPSRTEKSDFGLRIFNPDGSEAEKSGNGLRIFSRYLWDMGQVSEEPFAVDTLGGLVKSEVRDQGKNVKVEMGRVSFDSATIPVLGEKREVLNEEIAIDGEKLTYCAATIGNPHCVVISQSISEAQARRFGPFLEVESRFPNRTNVQFMQVLDRNNIQLEIWERGAGYTLASGSSSSAAAAVARRLDLCDAYITVHMPGGFLDIEVSPEFEVTMTGPVTRVAEGFFYEEIFSQPS